MPKLRKTLAIACFAMSSLSPSMAQEQQSAATSANNRPALSSLTPEERLAQTIFIAVDSATADEKREAIEKGLVGGVLLQWGDYSLEQTKALAQKLQSWAAKSPSRVPLLLAADYEGGTVFTPATLGLPNLPSNMMMGSSADDKDSAVLFYLAGVEIRKVGIHINFAPVLDVNTNSANPIIGVRSFGSDPELVSRMGISVIRGLQAAGVAAVAKHFPGHGDARTDSHLELPVINLSKEELLQNHIRPFADAIKAGVDAIMTAHVLYKNLDPDNPATFSRRILTDLLRNELGFNGIIFSDSLDMKGASGKSSVEKAAVRAKKAGADALLIGGGDPEAVLAALKKEFGENDKAMAKSAEAVMALKEKLGLFSPRPEASPAVDMAYQSTARAIAEKSVTLAWDKEALIPLPKPASGAKKPKLCGVFFCPPRYSYDLLEINTPLLEDGWDVEHYNAPMTPAQDDIARAKACAERSDALLIGTFQWAAQPYKTQLKAVRELLRLKKPTVLISMMSPYDILLYRDAPAALVTYGANRFSMQAAGEILSGKLPPEGELPFRLDSPASKP